jgi:energy-coupling factor transporter transmembrane protein EcfT
VKKDNWVQIVISLLLSIAVFVIACIVLKWALVLAALLSLGCYTGLSFLFTPILRIGGVNIEHMKNSEEIMTLLEEGEKDLASIKAMMEKAQDPQIKAKAQDVYREGGKIIEYIKKNPAKAVMARKFFNYYLEKAEELLKKYRNLTSAGIETDRLHSLKDKTFPALELIAKGMKLQFSRLISSEVIDIEADIRLLESTVRMEDS